MSASPQDTSARNASPQRIGWPVSHVDVFVAHHCLCFESQAGIPNNRRNLTSGPLETRHGTSSGCQCYADGTRYFPLITFRVSIRRRFFHFPGLPTINGQGRFLSWTTGYETGPY